MPQLPSHHDRPGIGRGTGVILLGVTGCIAAYKSCEILRLLQKAGEDVKVVMTEHATHFVGPTTFKALSGHEVAIELFDEPGDPIHHISLAKEPDAFLIAPATANVIAKIACGVADDLLTTTALATKKPLVIAPAMNSQMWSDEATQRNIEMLEARGVTIVRPDDGYLACGDVGQGRLADIETIVDATLEALARVKDMEGMRVLVTAGPTQEPFDPVRYISNGSSGRSGYDIAKEAHDRGAQVTLVSGPVSLPVPEDIDVIHVRTAEEMLEACKEPFENADVAVFVAAVSDWRPESTSDQKLKHDGGDLTVTLVPNPDIAATLAADKGDTLVVVYAAETRDVLGYAKGKLVAKNADLVVANDVSGELGMNSRDNKVWFVEADGITELPVMPKRQIARALFAHLLA